MSLSALSAILTSVRSSHCVASTTSSAYDQYRLQDDGEDGLNKETSGLGKYPRTSQGILSQTLTTEDLDFKNFKLKKTR